MFFVQPGPRDEAMQQGAGVLHQNQAVRARQLCAGRLRRDGLQPPRPPACLQLLPGPGSQGAGHGRAVAMAPAVLAEQGRHTQATAGTNATRGG